MTDIIYCADGVVRYNGQFVFVKRLAEGSPLALPGGKQECDAAGNPLEPLCRTMLRELKEETGLTGNIVATLSTYADDGRDPRGQFISTVFVVDATGVLSHEQGKTQSLVLGRDEVIQRYTEFAFDHADIMKDYFRLESSFFT